jgi:hypothetical protein
MMGENKIKSSFKNEIMFWKKKNVLPMWKLTLGY